VKDGFAIEIAAVRFSGHDLIFQLGKDNHRPNATLLETLEALRKSSATWPDDRFSLFLAKY